MKIQIIKTKKTLEFNVEINQYNNENNKIYNIQKLFKNN